MEKLIQYRTKASLYDGAFDSVVGWSAAGMGYILVTINGNLVVIDGGFGDDAEDLIALIKETSVVSFIAVVDVTKSFQNIAASTYEYFVPYIVLAIVYLVLVLAITWLIKLMEKRLAKNER